MDYVIFDLEWNQCPYGKGKENPKLPFEIIEIGAVKMDGERNVLGTFHRIVNRWSTSISITGRARSSD